MEGLCQNCGKRKATIKWLGHGSSMDLIHGNYQIWCKVCVLEYQIKYNKEQLKDLPKKIRKWEKELAELVSNK